MKGKYIYSITEKRKLGKPLKNEGLKAVEFNELSAITVDSEYKNYKAISKEDLVKELTQYQQMIEKIMEKFGAVLPVKFGTILKDEQEVELVLKKGHSFLQETLRKMEGKVELDLVCFWNEQKAAHVAYKESKVVKDLKKKITKKERATFEDKIALGKAIANYLASKKTKITNQILKVLDNEAEQSCKHILADVNMLFNRAFLVETKDEANFNHVLNLLDSKFADLVNFRLVGPLPPYSFATVIIEVLDKGQVEKATNLLNLNGGIREHQIKKAYDQLAFKLHPDHGGDPAKFKQLTASYKLLKRYAKQGLVGVYPYKWEER